MLKEEIYVKIPYHTRAEKSLLLSSNLMILSVKRDYVEVLVSSAEINSLKDKGFEVEILYNNSVEYFEKVIGKSWADSFHTYPQMALEMEEAAILHPDIMRLDTLGFSTQGRPILGAEISLFPDSNNLAKFRITGLHHGNELMSAEIPLAMMHYLLDNYGILPQVTNLVNNREVWIIPMVNPDGRMAAPSPT